MADPEGEQIARSVYLVQHGEAEPKGRDPRRPLTAAASDMLKHNLLD